MMKTSPQFVRFLLAGGLAAGANLGSRFLFSVFFNYTIAVVLAYFVGMLVAFVLMRTHVFDAHSGSLKSQVLRFTGINFLALVQTLLISLLLARWLFPAIGVDAHAESLAHLVGVLVPVISSYFGHKLLTFR